MEAKATCKISIEKTATCKISINDVSKKDVWSIQNRLLEYENETLIRLLVDRYGWSQEFAFEVFIEMKKLFCIALEFPKENIGPSSVVDKVLHNFILMTEDYDDFCEEIGVKFHHVPMSKSEESEFGSQVLGKTISLMEEKFCHVSEIWTDEVFA